MFFYGIDMHPPVDFTVETYQNVRSIPECQQDNICVELLYKYVYIINLCINDF